MSSSPANDASLLFEAGQDAIERPIVRLFKRYAREHRILIGIGTVAAVISPVAALLPIYLVETVIDGVLLDRETFALPLVPTAWLPAAPYSQLALVTSLMVGLALVGAGTSWLGAWTWGRFGQAIQHDIRIDAYAKAQRLGLAFYEDEQSGQLVSVLNDDVNQLQDLLEGLLARGVEILARFVAIVGLLFLLHWQLALVLTAVIPVLGGTARYFVVRLKPKYRAVRQRVGALNARIQNTVLSMQTIKAYSREPYELERIRGSSRAVYDRRWDVIRTRAQFFPTMTAVNWFGFGALLLVGGYWIVVGPPLVFTRPLQVGTLVSFMLFSQQFTTPLVQAAHLVDEYYDSRASVTRIFALADHPVEIEDAPDPIDLDTIRGNLALQSVSFGYVPGDPVLRDISFEIDPGTFVGIVGPTGSGKTTLTKLLLRFYDPDAGRIRIDGHDVRTVDRRDLRGQFGVVSQDPGIFTGSVRENIAFGREDVADAEIRAAAEVACADEFVAALPEGYDTPVGERGVKLSGGQRQRIALARAIVSDAPILVLDEALSHVDVETETAIRRRLREVRGDRTIIAIAHRLSTIRHADTILVLDDGEMVEAGSHDALLEADGLYAALWRMQLGDSGELARTPGTDH